MTRSLDWLASPFTGLVSALTRPEPRPHDPDVAIATGELRPWGPGRSPRAVGGAGWDEASARAACLGEALERLDARPLPSDGRVTASHALFPLDEPAVPPERFVLFHPEQYRQAGFPFRPFTRATVTGWVAFREHPSGAPHWVPDAFAHLEGAPGEPHTIAPGLSTGLSCGPPGVPVLLRGLQEVIERDALAGAWLSAYRLEEWPAARVLAALAPEVAGRVLRPNLTYRFYRVATPFAAHVTIVTLGGKDREGFVFSVGSACRETRAASWTKALLEAIQGRPYVRWLRGEAARAGIARIASPRDFAEHALHASLDPARLEGTPLALAATVERDDEAALEEGTPALGERLGPDRPILARSQISPALAAELPGVSVLRVVVPGLTPLHGSHALAHLGGPLWAPRGLAAWAAVPPHPFP